MQTVYLEDLVSPHSKCMMSLKFVAMAYSFKDTPFAPGLLYHHTNAEDAIIDYDCSMSDVSETTTLADIKGCIMLLTSTPTY